MAAEWGFVYFLANESMPGIYKIGFTLNHPRARMEQLSGATACPTPFEILACFGCESPREVESQIHSELARYRINMSREFFEVPLWVLQDTYRRNVDPSEELCNSNVLDEATRISRSRAKKSWLIDYFHEQSADPIHWPEPFKWSGECPF